MSFSEFIKKTFSARRKDSAPKRIYNSNNVRSSGKNNVENKNLHIGAKMISLEQRRNLGNNFSSKESPLQCPPEKVKKILQITFSMKRKAEMELQGINQAKKHEIQILLQEILFLCKCSGDLCVAENKRSGIANLIVTNSKLTDFDNACIHYESIFQMNGKLFRACMIDHHAKSIFVCDIYNRSGKLVAREKIYDYKKHIQSQ